MRTRASPGGRRTGIMAPVEVSLCAHATASALGSLVGSGASPGSAVTTIGSRRNGAPAVTVANFWENSPKARCSCALADEPGGGGVPEGGGPAVAERDLVAVGEREELAQAGTHPADEALHRGLAMRGAHQGGARAGEMGQLLGADLRRAAAEAPVGGPDGGRDLKRSGGGVHRAWTVANARSPAGRGGSRRSAGRRRCRGRLRWSSSTHRSPRARSTRRRRSRRGSRRRWR